jgi:hypothetical protein
MLGCLTHAMLTRCGNVETAADPQREDGQERASLLLHEK